MPVQLTQVPSRPSGCVRAVRRGLDVSFFHFRARPPNVPTRICDRAALSCPRDGAWPPAASLSGRGPGARNGRDSPRLLRGSCHHVSSPVACQWGRGRAGDGSHQPPRCSGAEAHRGCRATARPDEPETSAAARRSRRIRAFALVRAAAHWHPWESPSQAGVTRLGLRMNSALATTV
jgi:hypothetical protein